MTDLPSLQKINDSDRSHKTINRPFRPISTFYFLGNLLSDIEEDRDPK